MQKSIEEVVLSVSSMIIDSTTVDTGKIIVTAKERGTGWKLNNTGQYAVRMRGV